MRLDVLSHPGRPIELYNLARDLGETHNVAAENPQVVKRMQQIMQDAHVDTDRFHIPKKGDGS